MSWDTVDSDIETKFTELKDREGILRAELAQLITYQKCINSLKMVPFAETQDVIANDQLHLFKSLPDNFAGNEITFDYRDSQKADLIVNIDKFLDNADV